jgi:hypothetical protein
MSSFFGKIFNKIARTQNTYILFVNLHPNDDFNLLDKDWVVVSEAELANFTPHGSFHYALIRHPRQTETLIKLKPFTREVLLETTKDNLNLLRKFCKENEIGVVEIFYNKYLRFFSSKLILHLKNPDINPQSAWANFTIVNKPKLQIQPECDSSQKNLS